MLHGCRIGDGSLIGIGSTILNRAEVGAQCIVGRRCGWLPKARSSPPRSLIVGSPGRVVRQLRDDELATLSTLADSYVQKTYRYQQLVKLC